MERQILSQEEINALLNGEVESDDSTTAEVASPNSELNDQQKDALGEIGNVSYGTASTALSKLVNKRVEINAPSVVSSTPRALQEQVQFPYVLIEVDYRNGLQGGNLLIIKQHDAAVIADLMMSGDGTAPKEELGEMEMSALTEAASQMVGNAATSLSAMFSKRIDIDSPQVKLVNEGGESLDLNGMAPDDKVDAVSFKLLIEGLIDSEVMLLFPHDFAVELIDLMLNPLDKEKKETVQEEKPEIQETPKPAPIPAVAHSPQGPTMVQPAKFASMDATRIDTDSSNIGLILDVPLKVTVELGSTKMKIKDILELGIGSIIELDKLAGDPVDIFVNGKLIAKGEVMVIDENFGIKVTDIVSQMERANTLQ